MEKSTFERVILWPYGGISAHIAEDPSMDLSRPSVHRICQEQDNKAANHPGKFHPICGLATGDFFWNQSFPCISILLQNQIINLLKESAPAPVERLQVTHVPRVREWFIQTELADVIRFISNGRQSLSSDSNNSFARRVQNSYI